MVSARAIGLVMNDPQRGHVALHVLRDVLGVPVDADGYGVASCVDASVLLTRRPTMAPSTSLVKLVGPQKGTFAVVQFRTAGELRPPRNEAANLGPFRGKSLAVAVTGGPQTPEAAAESREQLLEGLPDFLRRLLAGQTESEAFFAAILAHLHHAGVLDRGAPPSASSLVDAIRHATSRAGKAPRHIMLASGADLVHVAQGGENALLRVDGLDEGEAGELEPGLADSSIGRERLRRFHAVLALGAMSASVDENLVLPKGVTLIRQAPDAAVVVSRDLEIRNL